MGIALYIFDGGALTAAAVAQGLPVPLLTKRVIRSASLVNKTAAPIAATVYLVKSGGAAGDAGSTRIPARTIAAGETYLCPELVNRGLNAGGFVSALGAGLEFEYTATDAS